MKAFLIAMALVSGGVRNDPVGGEGMDMLVIGDSISLGYDNYVAASLSAVKLGITVEHNKQSGSDSNAETSTNGVTKIDSWLGQNGGSGVLWDMVIFNHGLWDLNHSRQVPLNDYIDNMRIIANKIKAKSVKCAFVSLTYVVDGQSDRINADVLAYNVAAKALMAELNIPVIDLYPTSYDERARISDDVHFSEVGYSILGNYVSNEVLRILGY
jgi:lysophospholipase L1-like esterase